MLGLSRHFDVSRRTDSYRPARYDALWPTKWSGCTASTRQSLDQTFQWRGQQIVCGTMSLAALEALIAGVKVRCEVVERDRHGRQGLLAQWGRHRPEVSIGGVDALAVLEGLRRRRERGARKAKRGMWRGTIGVQQWYIEPCPAPASGCPRTPPPPIAP